MNTQVLRARRQRGADDRRADARNVALPGAGQGLETGPQKGNGRHNRARQTAHCEGLGLMRRAAAGRQTDEDEEVSLQSIPPARVSLPAADPLLRGLPDMTSAKFSDFLTPSPLVRIWN